MCDVGCEMQDAGRGMREESARTCCDAEACGVVHMYMCVACRARYTETMTRGLKGTGAYAHTYLDDSPDCRYACVACTACIARFGAALRLYCAAPGTALSCVAEGTRVHASDHGVWAEW